MADIYFILDNVQYVKDVFQNRNKIRIKREDGWQWLSVPVIGAKTHLMQWKDVRIDNSQKWRKKHLKSIYYSYSKAPNFQQLYEKLEKIYLGNEEFLLDFVVKISKLLLREYNVNIPIYQVSELIKKGFDIKGSKSDLIVKMCKAAGANNFIFGSIGRTYIDKKVFEKNNINYYFQNFKHPEYKQMHGKFISHMSSIDLLFNHGKESIKILCKSSGDTE